MKVLVVDDEKLIRDVVVEYLKNEQMDYALACDGQEALDIVKNDNDISIIVMDIMMPNMDGFTAYKEISKIRNIPCIMLSARTEEYDKLTGFEMGVDDYLTKPFSPKELIARIKAIMKRVYFDVDQIECSGIRMDNLAHEVYVDDKLISFTPKEYDLLKYVMENVNIAMSRENLLSNIWGYDFYGDDRTVDTHIKTLRSHLGKYRNIIKTIRGIGYKIESKK